MGTGILLNRTDGGEGSSGCVKSDETRALMSAAQSGENNPNYGKRLSTKTRVLMSAANSGEKHHMYGKRHSYESKVKISAAQSGEKHHYYGKHLSEEHRAKISATLSGKPFVECPHCGKQGKGGAMIRYHFANCKTKLCC